MIFTNTLLQPHVPTAPSPETAGRPDGEAALRLAARAFEAAFLAEMLRAAGVGRARDSFGGGAGETQVAGFMADVQATQLAEAGGIGLAETIFEALQERADDTADARRG